jgi:hypothetical protein
MLSNFFLDNLNQREIIIHGLHIFTRRQPIKLYKKQGSTYADVLRAIALDPALN